MYYLDTSALAKLVVAEAESEALRVFLAKASPEDRITTAVTPDELLRAASRQGEVALRRARDVLDGVWEITLEQSLLDAAATIGPLSLRTLDAIHLATAIELGHDLTALVAYDQRLLDAAVDAGLPVLVPV